MTTHVPVGCDSLTAYLLGELPDGDVERFLTHRRDCRRCQAELAEVEHAHRSMFEDDVDAECEQIAASARARTLAAAFAQDASSLGATHPQTPETTDSQAQAPDTSAATSSSAAPDAPELPAAWLTSGARRDRRTRAGRPAAPFAAVAASVATLVLGVLIGSRVAGPPSPMAPPTVPAEIVHESALRPVSATLPARGNATLVRHGAALQMIVSVAGLPPVRSGGCYSVWLVDGSSHRLLGEINVNKAGSGAMTAPVAAGARFTYVGVTREPDMADRTPRGPRIMGAAFTHL